MADEELKQNLENPTTNENELDDSKLKEVAGGWPITKEARYGGTRGKNGWLPS